MMRGMKWIARILSILMLLVLLAVVAAYSLPAQTTSTRTIMLKQPPDAIFAVLVDVLKLPDWNRNMTKLEMLPPIDGKEATRQTFKGGMTMTIVTTESLAPTHLEREMRDEGGPFQGSWTYEITPTAEGSKVALTERSQIKKPFFRLMVRIFGATKYMDDHLVDLAKRFGENARLR